MLKKQNSAKKLAIIILILLVGTFAAYLVLKATGIIEKPSNSEAVVTQPANPAESMPETQSSAAAPASTANTSVSQGRYSAFSETNRADQGYSTTVLFFHAGWCPECRAFKQAITSGTIPEGVQVLEVNYDTASDLKKTHSVTLQSTFVKVDSTGKQQSKWVGYGKNKSLETVLDNLN